MNGSENARPPDNGSRLDSWKSIAAYLGRDTGTVRRWERTRGLPVHRVPGGKGSSVFAYTGEIDLWLHSAPDEPSTAAAESASVSLQTPPSAIAAPRPTVGSRWAVASAVVAGALLVGWRMQQPRANAADLRIEASTQTIAARTVDGKQVWVHRLDDEFIHPLSENSKASHVIVGDEPSVYFITSHRERRADNSIETGELTALNLDGRPRWTFRFDDTLKVGGVDYTGPWAVTAFAINDRFSPRRIAVAAHHWTWGPSMVAILDDSGTRLGTYANHGWLEQVQWVAPGRLAIGGFSQSKDGGLVALVDTSKLDAQSPEADEKHQCANCGRNMPLRIAVMPRSEINLATHSRFNRAILERAGERVIARTVEVPGAGQGAADIIYEFSPALELLNATFSQRYWEVHDQLFSDKKLDHDRNACPHRDGPPPIHIWSADSGWTMKAAR